MSYDIVYTKLRKSFHMVGSVSGMVTVSLVSAKAPQNMV